MSQVFEYKGVVEEIGAVQSFTSGFTKREMVVGNSLDEQSKYPNPVKFVFKKDNCKLLDGLKKGDPVTVSFVVDGRRWDGPKGAQYFIDLTGLKVESEALEKKDGAPIEGGHECVTVGDEECADDIPF